MTSFRGKFRVVASLAALFLLAGAISCKGFFVNPTLTGITVTCPSCSSPSSPNISGNGASIQLLATGNYDDGSSKSLTSDVSWSSADDTQVSVDNTTNKGRATAKTTSTTTGVAITATDGVVSGQVSVTVGQTANTVSCSACSNNAISLSANGSTLNFTSTLASNWSANNSQVLTISTQNSTTGTATLVGTGTVTVTATPTGSGAVGTLTITVNQ